jgi:hypothetical protein
MTLLVVTLLAGTLATATLLWPWIGPLALLAAPFGGSLFAGGIFGYLAWHMWEADVASLDAVLTSRISNA